MSFNEYIDYKTLMEDVNVSCKKLMIFFFFIYSIKCFNVLILLLVEGIVLRLQTKGWYFWQRTFYSLWTLGCPFHLELNYQYLNIEFSRI